MTTQETILKIFDQYKAVSAWEDAFELVRTLERADFSLSHEYNKRIRKESALMLRREGMGMGDLDRAYNLQKKTLLFDAPHEFDAAIQYAEWNRDPKKKFYVPRRKQLKVAVDALQQLEERVIRILGIMMPPGVGKSTVGIMYMIWTAMRHPELSILEGSHSNSFLGGVYDEVLRMIDPKGEYLWHEIFPTVKIVGKNAKDMRIDLGKAKRFETFEFSSIGSGNAGKVRASNLLYSDDLVDGIESAMSKDRMDKLWQQYYTDLRQRMIGDCVELLIQTPWTLHDPIDRLEIAHADDPKAKFIHLPALDENDQSNFDYPYGLGFTTQFYHEQRDIMDDVSWRAIYMTQPIEREGLLYHEKELRRYYDLPVGKPDAIISICDTKDTGTDFGVMPIGYLYGSDYYIEDCVCTNAMAELTDACLVNALLKNNVQMCQFESNAAGGRIADKVYDGIKTRNGVTHITKRYTISNKETRIVVNAQWVKDHCLFKDKEKYQQNSDYGRFVKFLLGYTMSGRNKNDDVPDAMAFFSEFAQSLNNGKVEVFKRPF